MIDEFYVKKQQLAASQRPALSLSLVRSPGISPSSLFASHSNMQQEPGQEAPCKKKHVSAWEQRRGAERPQMLHHRLAGRR